MADFQLRDNQRNIDELSTPHFYATIGDDAGTVLPLSAITAMTLTVWWNDTPSTRLSINGWNAQNCLNVNGCTFAATSGRFDWYGLSADATVQSLDQGVVKETHYFRIDYSYNSTNGVRKGKYLDFFYVLRQPILKS